MKQLLGILFVLGALLLNSNITNAQVSTTSGCLPGHKYSSTTGEPCTITIDNGGCLPGHKFSSTTGEPCSTLITVFPPGCTSNQGYSSTTGKACNEASNSIVISGVSGPQTLGVNEEGTWTVKASSKYAGNLSYSVWWGDEGSQTNNGLVASMPEQQSATFSHKYSAAGTYKLNFIVTGEEKVVCFRAPCPAVKISASASLSVNVVSGTTTQPSIKVISPNGGESYKVGDTLHIKWASSGITSASQVEVIVEDTRKTGDNLEHQVLDVLTTNSGYYSWKIPASTHYATLGAGNVYKVWVRNSEGMSVGAREDSSNGLFSITPASTSTSPSITVLSPNGGEEWKNGATNYIKWNASNTPTNAVVSITLVDESTYVDDVHYTNSYGIVSNYCDSSGDSCVSAKAGSYKWKIPNDVVPGQYRVLVICMIKNSERSCDLKSKDFSDKPFSIISGTTTIPAPEVTSLTALEVDADPSYGGTVMRFDWTTKNTSTVRLQTEKTCHSNFTITNALDNTPFYCGDVERPEFSANGQTYLRFVNYTGVPISVKFLLSPNGNMLKAEDVTVVIPVSPHWVLGTESFTFTLPLKKGSTGSEVMELQKFLNKSGYDVGLVDGLFGTQVHNALVKLQVANGLTADGIVGPLVRAALNK